jgi:spore coat-associated protein N
MQTTAPHPAPAASRVFQLVRRLTVGQRLVITAASLMLSVGLTGAGLYATFTTSATASHTASTATMSLTLGATGASTNRLTVDASGLMPGDSYARSFDLTNGGSSALAGITLTTSASPSSLLDTDATNGLQMVLQRCSVAWTETGSSPSFAYSCSGTTSSVLASRAIIGTSIALSNVTATAVSTTDHLLLTVTLPVAADDTFQGLSSTLSFSFNGA